MEKAMKKIWKFKKRRNAPSPPGTETTNIETNSMLSTDESHYEGAGAEAEGDYVYYNGRQNSCNDVCIEVNVFNYMKQDYEILNLKSTQPCEHAISEMCRLLKFLPNTQPLFGICSLDNYGVWIPLHSSLESKQKYCLRMRFKMEQTELRKLDAAAHAYLFWQICYDMRKERLKELTYANNKNEQLGLAVVHMYIDIKMNSQPLEAVIPNYVDYLPASLVKEHGSAVKEKMRTQLKSILLPSQHTVPYAMNGYITQVLKFEKNYMLEKYVTTIDDWPAEWKESDNNLSNTSYCNGSVDSTVANNKAKLIVSMELDVTNESGPCVKITPKPTADITLKPGYIYLDKIVMVSLVENNIINLDTEKTAYRFTFKNSKELENFVTYLDGYIRLTTYWYFNVCLLKYPTPSLCKLKEFNCHGPIGSENAYLKILKERARRGSYVLRQCEFEYDTFFVDIVDVKDSLDSSNKIDKKSFKIVQTSKDNYEMNYECSKFIGNSLQAVVQQIPLESNIKLRVLKPADKEYSEKLLICYSSSLRNQKKKKEHNANELLHRHPEIVLETDLKIESNSNNGFLNALWQQRGAYKDIKVTVARLLGIEPYIDNINWFSKVCSPHIMKLYGFTVPNYGKQANSLLIFERHECSLSTFLKATKITISMRLQVLDSLVRALLHLWDRQLVHGYLRCENLYVISFGPNELVVKVNRPLMARRYSQKDLPWLPIDDDSNESEKIDVFTDIWAFGTTVYEVICENPILHLSKEKLENNFKNTESLLPKKAVCKELEQIFDDICIKCWCSRDELKKNFKILEILDALNDCKATINDGIKPNATIATPKPQIDEPKLKNCVQFFTNICQEVQLQYCESEHLGIGHFGVVFKGRLVYSDGSEEEVAVKKLNVPPIDFQKEIEIMNKLDHENIVKSKQWVNNMIVMEYMKDGSLLKYVQESNPTAKDLLRIALKVANGMDYLCKEGIVHRDLAARNILLDIDKNYVKISDFGLSRPVDKKGYYVPKSKTDLPILWHAVESLGANRNEAQTKFTSKSDVWSFGVTLYEMFSCGEIPNKFDNGKEITIDQLIETLQTGARLCKPVQCPDIVYTHLMKYCWLEASHERPSFEQIIIIINNLLSELKFST